MLIRDKIYNMIQSDSDVRLMQLLDHQQVVWRMGDTPLQVANDALFDEVRQRSGNVASHSVGELSLKGALDAQQLAFHNHDDVLLEVSNDAILVRLQAQRPRP